MLSAEQRQQVQITLDDLAIQALVAWRDAKTLTERLHGRADAQGLTDRLWVIMEEAKGVAAVLREEGVLT